MGVLVYSFGFTVYGRGCRAEGLGLGIWGEKGVGRIYFGVNGQWFFWLRVQDFKCWAGGLGSES